jgi:hypothetical protein
MVKATGLGHTGTEPPRKCHLCVSVTLWLKLDLRKAEMQKCKARLMNAYPFGYNDRPLTSGNKFDALVQADS